MEINKDDLEALKLGKPPKSTVILDHLTVPNPWLDVMKEYYLEKVISKGGSKVKILYGGMATGKSHFLRSLKTFAEQGNYFTLELDLSELKFHLTDSVALYRALAAKIELERLEDVITQKILTKLGYDKDSFKNTGLPLTDYLCEKEGSDKAVAKKTLRTCVNEIVKTLELEFSFRKFMHMFMEAVVEKDTGFIETARNWIRGDKLERSLKAQSLLYETLAKYNARSWLYSLVEIIKFMNYKGVVILIDQFEAILPGANAQLRYSLQKRNDVYELLRQLIDDLDFFKNILILIAGRTETMDNVKYGLQSYHALWMRIQPGFEQDKYLNVYADLVDADLIFYELRKGGKLQELKQKLSDLNINLFQGPEVEPDLMGFRNFRDLFVNPN